MKFLKKLFGKRQKKQPGEWAKVNKIKMYRDPPDTYRDGNGVERWADSHEPVKHYNALPMAKGDD